MNQKRRMAEQREALAEINATLPTSQKLDEKLSTLLEELFPRQESLSVLLLHVSQLEQVHLAPLPAVGQKRRRLPAPDGLLEQVLTNVQRVIRVDDNIVVQEGIGAALVFPGVDRLGIYGILERVYASVSLLQAETVVPPLTRETTILMGVSTYPEPAPSRDMLLYHAKTVVRCLTLRPALTTQLRGVKPVPVQETEPASSGDTSGKKYPGVPFMQLPKALPARLMQIVPYELARELRCVPVGREHQSLTVAMADPADRATLNRLREATGMHIFPVSCAETDLDLLLIHEW